MAQTPKEKQDIIKNESETKEATIPQIEVTEIVGNVKTNTESLEHNWKIAQTTTVSGGKLTDSIAKAQVAVTYEYGGAHIETNTQQWSESSEKKLILGGPDYAKLYPGESVAWYQGELWIGTLKVMTTSFIRTDGGPPGYEPEELIINK